MKRRLAGLLCVALAVSMLAGCGQKEETKAYTLVMDSESEQTTATMGTDEEVLGSSGSKGSNETVGTAKKMENANYVLIYNPLVYSADNSETVNASTTLSTGNFGKQIRTDINRAGGLENEEDDRPAFYTQGVTETYEDPNGEDIGVRAGLDPVYSKGDTHNFYYGISGNRKQGQFTCVYEGTHCYIWSISNSVSEEDAKEYGKLFDDKIYMKNVSVFGPARFTENGGKVNMLFYDTAPYGGFFSSGDLYATGEVDQAWLDRNKCNTDHAIIHIDDNCGMEYTKTVMAHEFQHLICQSTVLASKDQERIQSWLNEAMSACAEELNRKGAVEEAGRSLYYFTSELFRNGQSAYNFNMDYYSNDSGPYGMVYLFEEYLRKLAGDDVFGNVHSYWRNYAVKGTTCADAIANSVPSDVKKEIDDSIKYPRRISEKIGDSNQEWLSKLVLNMDLEILQMNLTQIDVWTACRNNEYTAQEWTDFFRTSKIYAEVNPAKIEGGGCVLIAIKESEYEIPEDADPNLIYVGLDSDFKPTGIVIGGDDEAEEEVEESNGPLTEFNWNGNKTFATFFLDEPNNSEGFNQMNVGICKVLEENGFPMGKSVRRKTAKDLITTLKTAVSVSEPFGAFVVEIIPGTADENEEIYDLLRQMAAQGTAILTLNYGTIPEDKLNWSVAFDYSALGKDQLDIHKNLSDKNMKEVGEGLGGYLMKGIDNKKIGQKLHIED